MIKMSNLIDFIYNINAFHQTKAPLDAVPDTIFTCSIKRACSY